MPVAAHALARQERRSAHVVIDAGVRAAVSGARPSLEEMLSLWSADLHGSVVLRVRLGPGGEVVIGAHLREHADHAWGGGDRDVARDVRRIREDVPVVVDLEDGGAIVVPLRALTAGGG
jgi:hypothetical protein